MKTAIILLGHGSRAIDGNTALSDMARIVQGLSGTEITAAYLQFCEPSLTGSIEGAVESGAGKIVVVPYFLYSGNHVTQDIPGELDALRTKHPAVEIVLTEHLGAHDKLAEIVMERINSII